MATPDILSKLGEELRKGITTEVQVVYLLAGIRKLIERGDLEEEFATLNFHCDWVLHSHLDRAGAKAMLRPFDEAHVLLREHMKLRDLPKELHDEIDRISKMKTFEEELTKFLAVYRLPSLTEHRPDGWTHFLHLYAKVIEDIPLVVKTAPRSTSTNPASAQHVFANVASVTVHCELAQGTLRELGREDQLYKISWIIQDKDGRSAEVFVINSFEINAGRVRQRF